MPLKMTVRYELETLERNQVNLANSVDRNKTGLLVSYFDLFILLTRGTTS